jgi:hypothetical protein
VKKLAKRDAEFNVKKMSSFENDKETMRLLVLGPKDCGKNDFVRNVLQSDFHVARCVTSLESYSLKVYALDKHPTLKLEVTESNNADAFLPTSQFDAVVCLIDLSSPISYANSWQFVVNGAKIKHAQTFICGTKLDCANPHAKIGYDCLMMPKDDNFLVLPPISNLIHETFQKNDGITMLKNFLTGTQPVIEEMNKKEEQKIESKEMLPNSAEIAKDVEEQMFNELYETLDLTTNQDAVPQVSIDALSAMNRVNAVVSHLNIRCRL